jgi:hypothetical protein
LRTECTVLGRTGSTRLIEDRLKRIIGPRLGSRSAVWTHGRIKAMHITSLEIILAVVAVFVIFGPKRLPKRSPKRRPVKLEKERVPVRSLSHIPAVSPLPLTAHHSYAAGRAPSPVGQRTVEQPPRVGIDRPQFASGDAQASPLPHEMPSV